MEEQSLIEIAKSKIGLLELSIRACTHEIEVLSHRRRSEMEQLEAWTTILQAEEIAIHRLGLAAVEIAQDNTTQPDPTPTVHAFDDPVSGETIVELDQYGSKTAVVRLYMEWRGKTGVTTGDVTAHMAERNIKVGANFANNTLFKMKQRGEVVQLGRRYYLKDFAPASMFAPANEKEASEETS